jgi:hypothetical protein
MAFRDMSKRRYLSADRAPHALLAPAFREEQDRRRHAAATRRAAETERTAARLAARLGTPTREADPDLASAIDNAATALRTLGELQLADPTLADDTGDRRRTLDLVHELDRQLGPLLRQLQREDNGPAHQAILRAEALAILRRIPVQAAVLSALARDPECPEDSQELSLIRLHDAAGCLAFRLEQALQEHLAAAPALPHPHDDTIDIAMTLAELAARLRAYDED